MKAMEIFKIYIIIYYIIWELIMFILKRISNFKDDENQFSQENTENSNFS